VAETDRLRRESIQPGQKVNFTVTAFPGRTFSGTVAAIEPTGTTTSNVVTERPRLDRLLGPRRGLADGERELQHIRGSAQHRERSAHLMRGLGNELLLALERLLDGNQRAAGQESGAAQGQQQSDSAAGHQHEQHEQRRLLRLEALANNQQVAVASSKHQHAGRIVVQGKGAKRGRAFVGLRPCHADGRHLLRVGHNPTDRVEVQVEHATAVPCSPTERRAIVGPALIAGRAEQSGHRLLAAAHQAAVDFREQAARQRHVDGRAQQTQDKSQDQHGPGDQLSSCQAVSGCG
jgi:hypothetical protein